MSICGDGVVDELHTYPLDQPALRLTVDGRSQVSQVPLPFLLYAARRAYCRGAGTVRLERPNGMLIVELRRIGAPVAR